MIVKKLAKLFDKVDSLEDATRHELMRLCYILEANPNIQPDSQIIIKLEDLVNVISDIKVDDEKSLEAQTIKLMKCFDDLRKSARVNTLSTKLYLAILNLAGLITSIMIASLLVIPMGLAIGYQRSIIKKSFQPRAFIFGHILGTVIGLAIGWRLPKRYGNKVEFRKLHNTINCIGTTLKYEKLTLLDNVEDSYSNCYKKQRELLLELFASDEKKLTDFLDSEYEYQLTSMSAAFFTQHAKGYLGHHSMVTFKINDKCYVIELGVPTKPESVSYPQAEEREKRIIRQSRTTTGEQILKMLAMNSHLQPRFALNIKNARKFLTEYKIGERDCHSYVSLLLEAVGEPPNTLEKTPRDHEHKKIGEAMANIANHLMA